MVYSTRNNVTLHSHWVPAVIGLVLATGLAFMSDQWSRWQDLVIPATEWVDFTTIYVPDFAIGDEDKTKVVFTVSRKKPVTYKYDLRVMPLTDKPDFVCFTSGTYDSIPGGTLTPEGYALSWLFPTTAPDGTARACQWYEGAFKLEQTVVFDDGYQMKTGHWQSNVFHVLPKGAQKYVKPEQVQTLEKLK